eukprot:CAMPEP_0172357818 /NCGR_PEP_ID=MMETSP1060-20121228/2147_1 /TAXON_ID=37318 /ORGANISM="Pseudo-nitzschia pungens, Strain cf. cingulata" /LENGTH=353 /DNA_ID=CAMNT_0013078673 /DNA_START=123 /DNA_END=1187 /DNA_ORIENTATION=-
MEVQAFLLVVGAGLCTAIGASVVFFPALANLGRPHVLAMALAFTAGTMLYVSLTDILEKSVNAFASLDLEEGKHVIYGKLSFFAGVLVMLVIDSLVEKLLAWDLERAQERCSSNVVALVDGVVPDGETLNKMREDFENKVKEEEAKKGDAEAAKPDQALAVDLEKPEERPGPAGADDDDDDGADDDGADDGAVVCAEDNEKTFVLMHMGWAMAVAIALHNFPEGMVTYMAYTEDASVGFALAIAIALHNIPEGLCVAMPLYYATGRRWYAFCWGTFSGLTEPLGALIVFFTSKSMSRVADGIVFGMVGGMMVAICIGQLLPSAFKYSSNAKHVTYVCLFGMFVLASSMMLFKA